MRVLATVGFWLAAGVVFSAELPRIFMDTRYVEPGGSTTVVGDGGNFQTALTNASCGDIITLNAGSTYTGNFTLPDKDCTDTTWIYVRTSTPEADFIPEGRRVAIADASLMAEVTASSGSVISSASNADHYRFIGIEVSAGAALTNLVDLSGGEGNTATQTNNIVFDRCYIHGHATNGSRRGILANGSYISVVDSYVSDFKEVGTDTQTFLAYNGSGPFKLVNNYLEAAGENVMFGGSDSSSAAFIPSDIEVRRNHFFKPYGWWVSHGDYEGTHWAVKNSFELKSARWVLIENNLFEHSWADGQTGYSVLFTVRNQDGNAEWSTIEDVTFRNNVVKDAAASISILGTDYTNTSQTTSRLDITNNFFENVDTGEFGSGNLPNIASLFDGPATLTIEFNTADETSSTTKILNFDGENQYTTGLVQRYNIGEHGAFGVLGTGQGTGNTTLDYFASGAVYTANVMTGGTAGSYSSYPGNFFDANMAAVGFEDEASGDYRLDVASDYYGAAPDGSDYGVWFPSAIAAKSQLDWDIEWEQAYDDVIVRFGVPGMSRATSCIVRYGNQDTTSSSGPSRRTVVLSSLTPATTYAVMVDCGDTYGGARSFDIVTAATNPGGTTSVPIQVGSPYSALSAARVTVDYGTTTAVSDGSVQNTSCASGCTVNLTLALGVQYYRWRWQTAGDAVLATSAVSPLVVQ